MSAESYILQMSELYTIVFPWKHLITLMLC